MLNIKKVLIDEKCYTLAEHFLSDYPASTEKQTMDLAVAIQEAIEDWFDSDEAPEGRG